MTMRMQHAVHGDSLADILERVLDKGVVVAGDVSVALVGIELLTIKLRLVVCSVDKARELGIDWWQRDPYLSGAALAHHTTPSVSGQTAPGSSAPAPTLAGLEERLARLEARIGHPEPAPSDPDYLKPD
ncbi:MAG: gas vesicle protein [Alphaproteobacteria bacterium]